MLGKALKIKKCRWCREPFTPWNSTQVNCSPTCAIEYVRDKQEKSLKRDISKAEKIARADLRKRKQAMKTRSDYEREAQAACNAYIRERDKHLPCISCGTTKPDIQYCAGHFKSVGGNPEIRYSENNIHLQCNFHCNSQKSGNISEYRPALIRKVGQKIVDYLEGPQQPQNRTIEDLIEIKEYYKEKLKLLK